MKEIQILDETRIRRIQGSFGFVQHRFLNEKFFASLGRGELILYFFLVLASDRFGISWYGDDSIRRHTKLDPDELEEARGKLASKSLIACAPPLVQLLELPERLEHPASRILKTLEGDRK